MIMQKKLFKIIYNYFPEADTDVDRWHEVIKTSGNNSKMVSANKNAPLKAR